MMNAHIEPLLRILLLIGVAVYLFVILWMMKKQKLKKQKMHYKKH